MPTNLDMTLLRTFVAVCDHAGMTAAGHALHLTQGAVSQQVGKLESALGMPLFVRSRRGLRLTPAGERLIGRARAMLALHDEVWADMTGCAVVGRVTLGVPDDLVAMLAPVVKGFVEDHPRVELSLVSASSSDLSDDVGRGVVDVAVVEEPHESAVGEVVALDRLVWVGDRDGRARLARPLPVSVVSQFCAFRPVVLDALRRDGRDWRTVFENGSLAATLATVRMGLAVTALLESTVPVDLTVLGPSAGLPELPPFALTLRVGTASAPAAELADRLRTGLARRGAGAGPARYGG
ncbi:LysR substrate-binding domain-containing protein [Amycolatopsis endophytica]|uniref:DNA-binding transcriptional LysR family regulator n=1 Tax=Amycolatopsis endophytica TaxID=860233 RepID=A0A853BAN6_9PSEU|nr:LysR family transcriptional regulator [Amycolatopsis endophytica]NYI91741.1 DNA-binding transcriptional LysR family regulator [Amycolatopsis endophytica]